MLLFGFKNEDIACELEEGRDGNFVKVCGTWIARGDVGDDLSFRRQGKAFFFSDLALRRTLVLFLPIFYLLLFK